MNKVTSQNKGSTKLAKKNAEQYVAKQSRTIMFKWFTKEIDCLECNLEKVFY